jgi:hypothetical protein
MLNITVNSLKYILMDDLHLLFGNLGHSHLTWNGFSPYLICRDMRASNRSDFNQIKLHVISFVEINCTENDLLNSKCKSSINIYFKELTVMFNMIILQFKIMCVIMSRQLHHGTLLNRIHPTFFPGDCVVWRILFSAQRYCKLTNKVFSSISVQKMVFVKLHNRQGRKLDVFCWFEN